MCNYLVYWMCATFTVLLTRLELIKLVTFLTSYPLSKPGWSLFILCILHLFFFNEVLTLETYNLRMGYSETMSTKVGKSCMYVCMYVCTYVCMYVRMYVCMYVFIHHSDHKNVFIYSYTSFVKSCIDKNDNVCDAKDITAYSNLAHHWISDGRDSLKKLLKMLISIRFSLKV